MPMCDMTQNSAGGGGKAGVQVRGAALAVRLSHVASHWSVDCRLLRHAQACSGWSGEWRMRASAPLQPAGLHERHAPNTRDRCGSARR